MGGVLVVMMLGLLCVLVLALFFSPYFHAKRRGHANLRGLLALLLISLVVWPLWLVAVCWAVMGRTEPVAA